MKLQPLLTDALQRNADYSVTFLTVSQSHCMGWHCLVALGPLNTAHPHMEAVMAHVCACHIQQICNMTKGRQRIEIWSAKETLINMTVKLNCPSLPMRCSVQLHEMELQNSFCIHNQSLALICKLRVKALARHPGQGNPGRMSNQTHFVLVQIF